MAAKHLIEALLNPFFIALLLLAAAIVALLLDRAKRFVRYSLVIVLIGLLVLSTGFFPRWLTMYLESKYPLVAKPKSDVQWIVILGGGQANINTLPVNNLLYSASLKRLLEGVRLFQQMPNSKLLLSGGLDGRGKTEAENLSEIVSWMHIPKENIVLEMNSKNTIGEVQEIQKWIGKEPFYLVTSATHMPRAMYLCKQQGLNPIAAPTDFTLFWDDERWSKRFIPNPNNIVYFTIAWHEILGIIWAKL